MTQIIINKYKIFQNQIAGIKSVSFDFLNEKVYSANKIQKLIGVFLSDVVTTDSKFVRWDELSWVAQKVVGTDVRVYVKSAGSKEGLLGATWHGPYLNSVNDISDITGAFLQFMIVLMNNNAQVFNYQYNNVVSPVFQSIDLSYLSSSNSAKFYSIAFNLGFAPKHVLLTYNGDVPEDAVIRFAISGFDSVDTNDYQYIDPDKIQQLSELSILSNNIKLMIEMIGVSGVPIIVHEVAFMFSGDEQLRLNELYNVSSSSSSST